MSEHVLQLFPAPQTEHPLQGLYLAHDLQAQPADGKPFVYTNYVVSLDGRISIPHPTKPGQVVPEATANDRDWRLFQELAIQADIILTSGRYLRDYADGRAQEILRVYDDPRFADLVSWREARGLKAQPDLAVISGSLNFPVPELLTSGDRRVFVLTAASADPERVAQIEKQTGTVIKVGETGVEGGPLVSALGKQGYRLIYNATGPKVNHLLLRAGVLNRLYLTYANRLLGGQPYSSIVEGDLLDPPASLRLNSLYLDPYGLDGLGQLFAAYDIA